MRFGQCIIMIDKFLCKNLFLRQPHTQIIAVPVNRTPSIQSLINFSTQPVQTSPVNDKSTVQNDGSSCSLALEEVARR